MFPTKSILVCTDLTERCEPALTAASDLALRTGARLHVLHAFELRQNPYVYRSDARHAFQALIEEARAGLTEQLKRTVSRQLDIASVTTEVFLPWKSIVRRAAAVKADVIILGPHEHVTGDRFLGSTADRVVRFAKAPTLIIRRGTGFDVKTMVLAIDGSPATSSAWTEAVAWAEGLHRVCAGFSALHVIVSASEWVERMAAAELVGSAVREAESELTPGVNVCGSVIGNEDPTDAIRDYVDEVRAQLLVLASNGHSAVDRLLNGSVTSTLAAHVGAALLIVPYRRPDTVRAADMLELRMPLALV
jgi:nucleotide-binding universal stress UspA family protein